MSSKLLFRWLFVAALMGTIAFLVVGTVPVRAQCGNPQPSSCTTCHAQADPVADKGEWHTSHASKDICVNCHGGNGSSLDKNLAHQGMLAQPLSDIYTDCHSCHPDYVERAVPYAATLQVTPSSCATPTPFAVSSGSNRLPPSGIVLPPTQVSAVPPAQLFLLLLAGLTVLALFCLGLCWLDRHHVQG